MKKTSAVATAAARLCCAALAGILTISAPAMADWKAPWKSEDRALVIDAYEFNPIDWEALTSDKRIAGFINKASDGLPPQWKCSGLSGDDQNLCKNRWWKYSVTKELYMTRRQMAKTLGLKWGAYHLGRPGNPREQADHFIDFAEPAADDLIAIDVEDIGEEWMTLSDAEIFADQIKIRTGRYPVLYTNGSTAKHISDNRADYPLLSRLPLWYARYRDDITGKFPEETWPQYALWQFSSMHNCGDKSCPYRVKGAKNDIDVNVSTMDVAGLRKAWPFDQLVERPDEGDASALIAGLGDKAKKDVAAIVPLAQDDDAEAGATPGDDTLVSAYGPVTGQGPIDPLKLLRQAAYEERQAAEAKSATERQSPVASSSADTVDLAPLASLAEATPAQRSKFRAMVQAAEAERQAEELPMPAHALSKPAAAKSGRGARPSSSSVTRPDQRMASANPVDRRIFSAFAATR